MMRIAILLAILGYFGASNAAEPNYITPEQKAEIERRATIDALDSLYLKSETIKKGNALKEESEKATMEILKPPKRKTVAKYRISMTDTEMRKIKVYPNQITTLTITDSMGVPWPLSISPMVAAESYKVSYQPTVAGLLTLETTSKFIPSSLVLALQDRLRPIQFQLESDNESLDYTVEITIEGKSPLNTIRATPPFSGFEVLAHDSSGVSVFLNHPPEDAEKLPTIGDSRVAVWRWQGMHVIRAPYVLIDPSNPVDVQAQMDTKDKVYLVKDKLDVIAFLNEIQGDVINVQVVGGYK